MEAWQGKGCVCAFVAWCGGSEPWTAGPWMFVEEGLQAGITEVALSQDSRPDLGCVLAVSSGAGAGGRWRVGLVVPRP